MRLRDRWCGRARVVLAGSYTYLGSCCLDRKALLVRRHTVALPMPPYSYASCHSCLPLPEQAAHCGRGAAAAVWG